MLYEIEKGTFINTEHITRITKDHIHISIQYTDGYISGHDFSSKTQTKTVLKALISMINARETSKSTKNHG